MRLICECAGIGRQASLRCLCSTGRVGSSPITRTTFLFRLWEKNFGYARVVELADSLDSGSSAHYGRAGSSPASRTTSFPQKLHLCARVVELADSLDSGSSAHYGRAGSSPASRTISSVLTAFEGLLRTLDFFIQRADPGRSCCMTTSPHKKIPGAERRGFCRLSKILTACVRFFRPSKVLKNL